MKAAFAVLFFAVLGLADIPPSDCENQLMRILIKALETTVIAVLTGCATRQTTDSATTASGIHCPVLGRGS
ncbi:hypothetical protein PT974_00439 [Cladobotryum mycophilum]|uniref:Hydrophobin n=1 Tax=Cladobotryum mycophilum TaxID=491253 RepID=A0ABR0T0X4_9HYPO